ncbi:hypothetical protein IQ62_31875 [Streptomyces scabiei]|nr:hypothetical protein IQ62_31875 [Streptomyces scabiei]
MVVRILLVRQYVTTLARSGRLRTTEPPADARTVGRGSAPHHVGPLHGSHLVDDPRMRVDPLLDALVLAAPPGLPDRLFQAHQLVRGHVPVLQPAVQLGVFPGEGEALGGRRADLVLGAAGLLGSASRVRASLP